MTDSYTTKTLIMIRRLLKQGRRAEAARLIETLLPPDQAELFLELPIEEQARLLKIVEVEDAADILEELDDEDAATLAEFLDPEALTRMLDEMKPDEAADLLGDLDPELRELALDQMDEADEVRPLLRYADDTAGGIMTSKYYVFPDGTSVGEAFRQIREHPLHYEEIPYVYAVDEQHRLTGIARLADLIRAHPEQPLSAIAESQFMTITADEDQEVAVELLNRYDLMALPVLNRERRLVGVITVDDAIATLEEEASEDIYKGAGILSQGDQQPARSDLLVRGPVWHAWWVRIPFLLITLVGGMLAGAVIGIYEEALESAVVLALFIPVVMNLGGNSGAQSTAIFIRGQVLGQINPQHFLGHLLREAAVGLGMGIILGALAGLIAGIWQGMIEIGLVVGLSLACTMTLAATLGFLIPYTLVKLGADPAAGSDPLITTIKDITSLLIYFFFANLFMSQLL